MKKVILVVAMVFATSSLVNANTSEMISEDIFNDCAAKAYAYGTKHGGGNAKLEYALTDAYYAGCMEA